MPTKKILFVMMSLPEVAPYISYYEHYLNSLDVAIDYVIWDRDGGNDKQYPCNYYIFNQISPIKQNAIIKIMDMYRYGKFVYNIINKHQYDGIISFTIQAAIFTKKILQKFKGKYIIDIRDYSPILKFSFFRKQFNQLIHNSYATVISSTGFLDFLPYRRNYILSHNIHPAVLIKKEENSVFSHAPYKILTIGQLRDPQINTRIIKILGNSSKFQLIYSGKGAATDILKKIVVDNDLKNISFTGAYEKKDEISIAQNCDMINAILPNNYNSLLLLSNRLYLSVILGKPIIVNKDSEQGKYVKRYSLGICIEELSTLEDDITSYIQKFNLKKYNEGRIAFLDKINEDNKVFFTLLQNFITHSSCK